MIRPAERADLGYAAPIFRAADADYLHLADDDGAESRALDAAVRDDLRVALAHHPEDVWVATASEQIVGFAAATVRGRHWHLSYLFVRPAWHGRGTGRRLLEAIHDAGRRQGSDFFSTEPSADPRALTFYLQLGLMPAVPAIVFEGTAASFPLPPPEDRLRARPIKATDAFMTAIGDIDAEVKGVRRPDDVIRWLAEGTEGQIYLQQDGSRPVGYSLLQVNDESVGRIGPVAALNLADVDAVMTHTLLQASQCPHPVKRWIITLPGENQRAIEQLLRAGFRPKRLAPLLTSGSIGRWDRYIFADLDLL